MSIRRPAVAGSFYPSSPVELRHSIEKCFKHHIGPGQLPPKKNTEERIIGGILPHAGYIYSGPVASHLYYALSAFETPDIIIILGPNHWNMGSLVSVYPSGIWETPLGKVVVTNEDSKELTEFSNIIDIDEIAHKNDHCIEVQLPFLQYIYNKDFKFLPIIMALQDKSTSLEVGNAISELAKGRNTIFLASSDFTHYEPHDKAAAKDAELINSILTLDISHFYSILDRLKISACGYGAIGATMIAAKKLGAKEGRLLKYATSGDVSGDKSSVVGYSSIIFV
jgi:AmmeMemoRadiSam system protein B